MKNTTTKTVGYKLKQWNIIFHSSGEYAEKWEYELLQPFGKVTWQYLKH